MQQKKTVFSVKMSGARDNRDNVDLVVRKGLWERR